MDKAGGTINVFGKIITYIFVVLLVLGIAGMVAYFALRGQGVTFYVEYNSERYFANSDGGSIELLNGETYTFSVKSLTGGEVNYDVKVTANSSNNFSFVYDGKPQMFYGTDEALNNYSEVFSLRKQKDGFSLTLPESFTVEKAVETKYGGDVELQEELQDDLCYFVITVTSGESVVNLWFNFSDLTVTLDPPQIIF